LGEKADKENIAKRYMEAVRRRKVSRSLNQLSSQLLDMAVSQGMAVERKAVLFAEKQKTIKNY